MLSFFKLMAWYATGKVRTVKIQPKFQMHSCKNGLNFIINIVPRDWGKETYLVKWSEKQCQVLNKCLKLQPKKEKTLVTSTGKLHFEL